MENIETYLNLNISYKDFYIENNPELRGKEISVEELYIAVSLDVDIVFSALNILPNKSGYLFWKDAVFLYLISGKQKVSICNDIYPLISKKYETTTMCVDRAMRRCFENVLYFALSIFTSPAQIIKIALSSTLKESDFAIRAGSVLRAFAANSTVALDFSNT